MSINNENNQKMETKDQNPQNSEKTSSEKEVLKVDKTINLDLTTVDANIFYIMGAFRRQARREKWTQEEIDFVLEEAKKHDYNHAIATISDYCEPKDEQEEQWNKLPMEQCTNEQKINPRKKSPGYLHYWGAGEERTRPTSKIVNNEIKKEDQKRS